MRVRRTGRRTVLYVLLACLLAVSILSGAVAVLHAHHAHDTRGVGGCCATCAQQQGAVLLRMLLGMACIGLALGFAALCPVCAARRPRRACAASVTPIALKIRLNN